jgi:hypothetical protein
MEALQEKVFFMVKSGRVTNETAITNKKVWTKSLQWKLEYNKLP